MNKKKNLYIVISIFYELWNSFSLSENFFLCIDSNIKSLSRMFFVIKIKITFFYQMIICLLSHKHVSDCYRKKFTSIYKSAVDGKWNTYNGVRNFLIKPIKRIQSYEKIKKRLCTVLNLHYIFLPRSFETWIYLPYFKVHLFIFSRINNILDTINANGTNI